MNYTDNLDDYKSYPQTNSCYLDGRYFNKVFSNYPGLISEPLHIFISLNKENGTMKYENYMKEVDIDNNYPGLLRVIINTPESRHSSLVIIDYQNAKLFRFDPLGRKSPYFDSVNTIIEKYMDMYIDFDMVIIDAPVSEEKNPTCLEKGERTGFCLAFVIKYAYDWLNGRPYDPSEIRRFALAVESKYGPLPEKGKDAEYGLFGGSNNPNQGRNVAVGALGGALLGGVLTGGAGGALVGGLGGGLIGGMI